MRSSVLPCPRESLRLCPAAPILILLATTSCAAAIVPIAAGGLVAGKRVIGGHAAGPASAEAAPAVASSSKTPSPPAAAATALKPMPADVAQMVPGQAYVGSLPARNAGASAPVEAPVPAPSVAGIAPPVLAESPGGWRGFVHYVARHAGDEAPSGVLPGAGSSLAQPRALPCGGNPAAVLVDLQSVVAPGSVVIAPDAIDALDAIRTIGITIVYTSRADAATVAAARAAIVRAQLPMPTAETLLRLGAAKPAAAIRARVGAHYCVTAIVAARSGYFTQLVDAPQPGAAIVDDGRDWSPGWFLVPPPARDTRP